MAAPKKSTGARRVRLYGLHTRHPVLEGELAEGETLADLVTALNARRWRIDDADGNVLCGPSGVRQEITATSRDAAAEGQGQ